MKFIVFLMLFILTIDSSHADIYEDITTNVRSVCLSPDKKGSYWDIESEGSANVGIKLLGTHLDLSGEVSAGEWDGIQRVLKSQQLDENKSYRDCVKELLPLFINKIKESNIEPKNEESKNIDPFSELPKKWTGTYNENGKKHMSMTIYIEKFDGKFFIGKARFDNNIINLHGEVVDNKIINDFVESSKWEYVDGYKKREDSYIWITFTLLSFIQGNAILLNTNYYANISEYNIRGVEFIDKKSTSPVGSFLLNIDNN